MLLESDSSDAPLFPQPADSIACRAYSVRFRREFFSELVASLAEIFGVSTVFIATCNDSPVSTIETLAVIHNGHVLDNFEYDVQATPSKVVYENGSAFFPTGVQACFPDDDDLKTLNVDSYAGIELYDGAGETVGHIGIMDTRELNADVWEFPALGTVRKRCGLELASFKACNARSNLLNSYRSIIESSLDGIFLRTPAGRFVLANDTCRKLFGIKKNVAEFYQETISEDWRRFLSESCDEVVAGESTVTRRHMIQSATSLRHYQVTQSLTTDAEGQQYIAGVIKDMTELVVATEAYDDNLQLASLGTVAKGIAHEISNPLSAIQLSAEVALLKLAATDVEGSREVRGHLNSILESVRAVSQIVDEVLRTRKSTGTERQPCNIVDILNKAVDHTRSNAESSGVRVYFDKQDSCTIFANSIEIGQVFVNLLLNAFQASSEQSADTVRISISREGDRCLVSVRDSGCGIEPEAVDRIFDPFFTTRGEEGGTGLGLGISRRIVLAHDGKITCVPSAQGAEFIVDLPVVEA